MPDDSKPDSQQTTTEPKAADKAAEAGTTQGDSKPKGMPADWAQRVADAEVKHGLRPADDAKAAPAKPEGKDPKGDEAGGDKEADTDPSQRAEKGGPKAPTLPKGVTEAQWDRAVKALKRDGYDDDDIEALSAKHPSRVIALGEKRADNQADVDRKLKMKEARGDTAPEVDSKPESAGSKAKNHGEQGDTAKLAEANLAKLRGTLGEKLGTFTPEEVDAVADFTQEFTNTALQNATAPLLQELETLRGEREELTKKVSILTNLQEEIMLGQYRRDFADEYPQLKDNERFSKLHARALRMQESEGDSFETFRDLFAEACTREFAKELAEQAKKDRAAINAKRNNGQPTVPNSEASGKDRPATKADARVELVQALEQGDKERARALAASAR